jgi:hypothetical protein
LLVSIRRADVDAFATQLLPRADQDNLVERNLETLAPIIAFKYQRGEVEQRPSAVGRPITQISLSRADLEVGMRRYQVNRDETVAFAFDAPASPQQPLQGDKFSESVLNAGGLVGGSPAPPAWFRALDPPELPAQGVGPHFELAEDGVIGFARPDALDRAGNNVERLRKLHPPLRELARQLAGDLGTGNIPHSMLAARVEEYSNLIDQELAAVDFTLLYVEGVRLANAAKAADEKITEDELPPLEEEDREKLQTILQLHGTFMLSTTAGSELIAAEHQYQRRPTEEREYREAAIDFASRLQNEPAIIAPNAATFVLGAAEQIGQGVNLERSNVVATSTLQNVAIVITAAASVAAFPIMGSVLAGTEGTIVGGLTALLASESLKKSKPFAQVIAPLIARLDQAAQVDFAKYAAFLLSVERQVRRLAMQNQQFQWLTKVLEWVKKSTNFRGLRTSSASVSDMPIFMTRDQLMQLVLAEAYMVAKIQVDRLTVSGSEEDGSWDILNWGYAGSEEVPPEVAIQHGEQLKAIARRLGKRFRLKGD